MARAENVVVDSVEQSEMESGDLLLARAEGKWKGENLIELKDVVARRISGRSSKAAVTIFKSNGLAVEDVAAAGWVYEQAVERGLGSSVHS